MYSEKIEALINAALADGELTEKEKQILFKRAKAEGIDLDEFEIVLDSRLHEMQNQKQDGHQAKYRGDVKKCPVCGATVQKFHVKCSECGYYFEDLESTKAAEKFAKGLDEIADKERVYLASKDEDVQRQARKRVSAYIANYPIPNTKTDLREFTLSLRNRYKLDTGYSKALFAKYKECIDKAKLLFPEDADLAAMVTRGQKDKLSFRLRWSELSSTTKYIIGAGAGFFLFELFCFGMYKLL